MKNFNQITDFNRCTMDAIIRWDQPRPLGRPTLSFFVRFVEAAAAAAINCCHQLQRPSTTLRTQFFVTLIQDIAHTSVTLL